MKKFSILFAIITVTMAVLFTSCDPTSGLEEISPSDVSESWVKGVWTGNLSYEIDGEKVELDVPELDYSSNLTVLGGVALFRAYAATGKFYANPKRTKVVLHDEEEMYGKMVETTLTLSKQ